MKISDISAEISDIGDNQSEIGHGNLFEGKIAENRKFRRNFADISVSERNFVCGTHVRAGDFLLQNIENISEISVKYRRYIENISKLPDLKS